MIEAAIEARERGLVRAIGVTGHGTQVAATHRRSLDRFDFDSVLLPYNYLTLQIPYCAENFDALQAKCAERQVAVQTIKSKKRTKGKWIESGGHSGSEGRRRDQNLPAIGRLRGQRLSSARSARAS